MRLRFTQFFAGSLLAFSSQVHAQAPDIFASLDADKDGFITTAEVPEDKKNLFERLLRTNDKNGDGKISRDEFTAKEADAPKTPIAPGGVGGEKLDPAQIIKQFDKNGDGKLSKDEAPDRMKENFERLDANGDGFVELPEFQQALARFAGGADGGANAIFDRQDANKDGKLTADEIPEERREKFKEMLSRLGTEAVDREQFARVFGMMRGDGPPPGGPGNAGMMMRGPLMRVLDADGDGELSAEEIANASKSLLQLDKDGDGKISSRELLPQGPPPSATTSSAEGAGGFNVKEIMARRFKEMDKNGDGKLQKDEASGPLAAIFDKADANSDGSLDEAEIRQAMEKMQERLKDGGEKVREKIREKLGK